MLPERPRAEIAFDQWIAASRSKALARGVTDDTYTRVVEGLRPDTTGLEAIHNQPEFTQKLWHYLNRVRPQRSPKSRKSNSGSPHSA